MKWTQMAVIAFTLWTASCSQETTLPRVLRNDERPTPLEISQAPEVGVCELHSRSREYVDELVRVRARWFVGSGLNVLVDPRCERIDVVFDEARMKRLSSSEALRTLHERLDQRSRAANTNFDVVFVGRFRIPGPAFDRLSYPELTLYSVESVTRSPR